MPCWCLLLDLDQEALTWQIGPNEWRGQTSQKESREEQGPRSQTLDFANSLYRWSFLSMKGYWAATEIHQMRLWRMVLIWMMMEGWRWGYIWLRDMTCWQGRWGMLEAKQNRSKATLSVLWSSYPIALKNERIGKTQQKGKDRAPSSDKAISSTKVLLKVKA